ncbi:glycosyltransferase family 2 protein [Epidermidibacterium keratini]
MPLKIAIGIPTFRRPDRLSQLLDALPHRIAELPGDVEVVVVVVDNDPAGTAREVVEASPLKARYEIEAMPGIAAARNRILDSAPGARLLAFIDDDTTPLEGWLSELVATWEATDAAAVMGWVISLFPPDTDPWVLASGVLQRAARPTGTVLAAAATASLLLDLEVTERLGLRFDSSLGLSGGEDTLFSRRLVAAGEKIVWCNESKAQDEVPPERLTRPWALRRAFNGGNVAVDIDLRLARSGRERASIRMRRAVGGVARIGFGVLRALWGQLRGSLAHNALGLRMTYRGCGMVAGAVGFRHRHYSR